MFLEGRGSNDTRPVDRCRTTRTHTRSSHHCLNGEVHGEARHHNVCEHAGLDTNQSLRHTPSTRTYACTYPFTHTYVRPGTYAVPMPVRTRVLTVRTCVLFLSWIDVTGWSLRCLACISTYVLRTYIRTYTCTTSVPVAPECLYFKLFLR
jgi:hypothetical protein